MPFSSFSLPTCPPHPQLRSAGAQALQEQLGAVTCVGSLDLSDNGEWMLFPLEGGLWDSGGWRMRKKP